MPCLPCLPCYRWYEPSPGFHASGSSVSLTLSERREGSANHMGTYAENAAGTATVTGPSWLSLCVGEHGWRTRRRGNGNTERRGERCVSVHVEWMFSLQSWITCECPSGWWNTVRVPFNNLDILEGYRQVWPSCWQRWHFGDTRFPPNSNDIPALLCDVLHSLVNKKNLQISEFNNVYDSSCGTWRSTETDIVCLSGQTKKDSKSMLIAILWRKDCDNVS